MIKSNKILANRSYILALTGLMSIILIIGAFIYYSYESNIIRNTIHYELKSLAELKIDQVANWNRERISDARALSSDPLFIKNIESYLVSKNQSNKKIINEQTSLVTVNKIYKNILIVSNRGKLITSFNKGLIPLDSVTVNYVEMARIQKRILNSGLYYDSIQKKIQLDYIAPIIGKNDSVIAAVILRVDPKDYLLPLIQAPFLQIKSFDAFLVKKDSSRAIYLSPIRNIVDSNLSLNEILQKKFILSVQAASGYDGFVDGKDHAGNSVLAYVSLVHGTNWYVVSEVHKSEIYSDLHTKLIFIVLFTLLLIFALSAGLFFIYSQVQKNLFKELFIKEKELREYHEEFRTILYSIGDGVIITDSLGLVKQLNLPAEGMTGWSEQDAIGKRIDEVFNIILEGTREIVESPVKRVLREGAIVGLANHTLLISKDGIETPIADSGAPIRNEMGGIDGVVLVFRDKSEEHKSEKLIRQSEARLRRAELTSKSGNWELHLNSNIMISSEGARKIYGLSGKDFDYNTIKVVPLPEYRAKLDAAIKNLMNNNEPYDLEFKVKAVDTGEIKYVHSIAQFNRQSNILFGVIHDISERKNAELAMRESEERFRTIYNAAPDGISISEINTGLLVEINEAYVRIFGFEKEEVIGKTSFEIGIWVNDDDRKTIINELQNYGKYNNKEIVFKRKDGSIIHTIISGREVSIHGYKYMLTIVNDITELFNIGMILRKSEERFRTTLYSIGDGVIATDENSIIQHINPVAEQLTGWKESEAKNKPLEEVFKIINETTRNSVENPVNKVLKEGKIVGLANHTLLISKDGKEIPIADSGAPIRNENGDIDGVVLVFRDQLKERAAQKILKESESQLKQSQRVARIGYYIFDIKTGIWTSSEMLDEIFGIDINYKRDYEGWLNIVTPEQREEMSFYFANNVLKDKNQFNKEYKVLKRNVNSIIWVQGLGNLELDKNGNPSRMFGTIQDITERKKAQNIIEQSLVEKEILLKEIHHRVKNNFQRIISLISLQADLIEDKYVLDIFGELQSRLRSMSLIHELMYGTGNFTAVDIKEYIESLANYLIKTYSSYGRITLNFDLESHNLNLDSIIPCGLIINEIITNSLKYGFPNESEGNIYISFKKNEDEFSLILSDNGIGIKNKIDFEDINSLGLRLVHLLTKQLRGSLEVIQPHRGIQFIIKFDGDS